MDDYLEIAQRHPHPKYGSLKVICDAARARVDYKITKIQATAGLVQLRRLDEMIAPRVRLTRQRTEVLKDIPELTLPYEPPGCEHTYYLYTMLVAPEWAGEK